MTAVLGRTARVGSTVPRLFTPPLPEHVGPDGLISRDWSWGYDCIHFLEKYVGWRLLPWQKWLYIHALEKGADGTGFRFKFIFVLIARQNGKSRWLKGLGLWRLFADEHGESHARCPGAKQAVLACQNLQYAELMLKEVHLEIADSPRLSRELKSYRAVNGQHRVDLTNERYWRAAAASRRGARSLTCDVVMLDELREHKTWEAWQAIVPTTTVVPYPQIVCCSNAGDSYSEVLRTQRDGALRRIQTGETADTDIGLWEWSVPLDVDPRDESYWYLANPAMGVLNKFGLKISAAIWRPSNTKTCRASKPSISANGSMRSNPALCPPSIGPRRWIWAAAAHRMRRCTRRSTSTTAEPAAMWRSRLPAQTGICMWKSPPPRPAPTGSPAGWPSANIGSRGSRCSAPGPQFQG